jgi:hypothetical protein
METKFPGQDRKSKYFDLGESLLKYYPAGTQAVRISQTRQQQSPEEISKYAWVRLPQGNLEVVIDYHEIAHYKSQPSGI